MKPSVSIEKKCL